MSFPIGTPPGVTPGVHDPATRPARPQTPEPVQGPGFARVYELEEARRRRDVGIGPMAGDRIPDDVWQEVEAASRLFDQLKSEGRQVMFDNDRLTGKVVASLLDSDGAVSNVPLSRAVDPAATPPIAANPASVVSAYGRSRTDV